MKILHLIESGGFYGAERVLIELVLGLKELKCESVVLSLGGHGENQKEIEKVMERYQIQYIPLRIKTKNSLRIINHINHLTETLQCNIVHSHGYKFNILLGLFKRRLNVMTTCTTVHGYVAASPLSKMGIYQWLDKRLIKKLTHVFLVTQALRLIQPLDKLNENKCTVIPNGVGAYNATQEKVDEQLLNKLLEAEFRMISIGRLAEEKGYRYLLEAVKNLKKGNKRILLVIFGHGPEREYLEQLICEYDIKKNVVLYGYTPCVAEYFQRFDCFVMPSLTEATPIALIEAMRAKIPCVATRVGEIPDMLEQGMAGGLSEPMQVNDLVENIESVMTTNAELKTELAYKKAVADYSYIAMAQTYLDRYRQIVF